jgi:UDP-N-acetylglucosamine/UDP-N-acetylgalactosamine diphosphorylase
MTYAEALDLLTRHRQEHVLEYWGILSEDERAAFLKQIASLDFNVIADMEKMIDQGEPAKTAPPEPATARILSKVERQEAAKLGIEALHGGKVGVILVAGGQGTRLGFKGPKGSFPIGLHSKASLFEIHAHKIVALERRHQAAIPFYVLDGPGHLFMGPDGHGGILQALADTGMLEDMKQRGLETLFYFQVDNPLVEIADPAFIGLHRKEKAPFSLKVCTKRDPGEKLGVITKKGQTGLAMVEYTELTDVQKAQRTQDGALYYKYGSVGIHVFSLQFLITTAQAGLPLHKAHKKVPFYDGEKKDPETPNAFKFEKFIFDALPLADRPLPLEFDRNEEFSPVKNKEEEKEDTPATSRRDMSRKFARWLEACGIAVPHDPSGYPLHPIEIDPLFASSPEELLEQHQKKTIVASGSVWLKAKDRN